jgi:hypothetical protein
MKPPVVDAIIRMSLIDLNRRIDSNRLSLREMDPS